MLMASTKKIGFIQTDNTAIYTRGRQMEYKNKLNKKTADKKLSQKALFVIMVLVVAVLFCSWFGMIFFKSIISGVQMDINNVNAQIRSLNQENSMLEAEKIKALDIEKIKISAQSMGMSLPSVYQVEYVDTENISADMKILD